MTPQERKGNTVSVDFSSWQCPQCQVYSSQAMWGEFPPSKPSRQSDDPEWGKVEPEDCFTITCPNCGISFEVYHDDHIVGALKVKSFTLPRETKGAGS